MIGSSLGPYKILEQLGAGGMGEVYLGEDTRLGRKVAIKVLPEDFASIPERLARFEQEARAAAALNHPHIAVVFDVGTEGDTHFMVQEYLEGQSLRERLDKGALPLDKALDLAIEVGEALIAAHKAGIIHRDLKPDNIFVTEEGHAKVLDFGLAKLVEGAAPVGNELSRSPTILGTVAGQVMGTAGYMAPEQVNGESVDHRADLFAFGCVLYEMASGRRAFAGDTLVQTLHRIAHEPHQPLSGSGVEVPFLLGWIVDKSLEKEPAKRYQHAGDLAVDLRKLQASGAESIVDAPASTPLAAGPSAWARAVLATLLIWAVGATGVALWPRTDPGSNASGGPVKFRIPAPASSRNRDVAVSPNGDLLAYTGYDDEGRTWLWFYDLRTGETERVTNTIGADLPFWRSDGSAIAFFTSENLMGLELESRALWQIAPAPSGRGGSWNADDVIVFAPDGYGPLYRVPAGGGTPVVATDIDPEVRTSPGTRGRQGDRFPQFLPDGRRFLFYAYNSGTIRIATLGSTTSRLVGPGNSEGIVVPGHLLFIDRENGNLMLRPFDLTAEEFTGPPMPIVSEMDATQPAGNALVSVSSDGVLAFRHNYSTPTRIGVFDRQGRLQQAVGQPGMHWWIKASNDGSRLAFLRTDPGLEGNIWVLDLATGREQRTGRQAGPSFAWFPNGDLHYGGRRLRLDALNEEDIRVVEMSTNMGADVAADGSFMVHVSEGANSISDIYLKPLPDGESELLVDKPDVQEHPTISPQNDWVTYESEEQGRREVHATSVLDRRTVVVSGPEGGRRPIWRDDGSELYYLAPEHVMVVPVTDAGFGTPEPLFSREGKGSYYDVIDNGETFLFTVAADQDGPDLGGIHVVVNWFEVLKERVSTGR